MAKAPAKKVAKTPVKKVAKKAAKKPAAKAKKSPVKKVAKKVAKKATPKKKVAKKAAKKPAAKKAKKPKKPVAKKAKKPKKAKKVVPKKPKKVKRKKGQKKDKDAPKRAMSAFFLFAQDERAKVKAANPSASIGDIGKELGARWAKCGNKGVYEKKAAVLKVKQQAEMAKYKAAKAKASGPKRALSAFFLFAGDERKKVVAANPSASIGEIGKELGARWAKASAAVKAAYQAKSDKDKARYAAEKAKFVAKK